MKQEDKDEICSDIKKVLVKLENVDGSLNMEKFMQAFETRLLSVKNFKACLTC